MRDGSGNRVRIVCSLESSGARGGAALAPVKGPKQGRRGSGISAEDNPRIVDGLGAFGWAVLFVIAVSVFALVANS